MRAKYIFLPLAAVAIIGTYSIYTEKQKSKFDSAVWKETYSNDKGNKRAEMLSPLVVHILKFGMSVDEIDNLLGIPNEERTGGDDTEIGAPHMKRFYIVEVENDQIDTLTLEFSHKMKLINFYIGEWPQPIIF